MCLCESIFKTGKKTLRHTAAGRVKGVRNSLAGAKVSEEGGGEVLQAPEQKSPAACGEDHGADLHAAAPPWVEEPPVEQVDVAWRRLRPMESPRRSRPGLDWNRLC